MKTAKFLWLLWALISFLLTILFVISLFTSIYSTYSKKEISKVIPKVMPDSVNVVCPHCGWEHTVWIQEVNNRK